MLLQWSDQTPTVRILNGGHQPKFARSHTNGLDQSAKGVSQLPNHNRPPGDQRSSDHHYPHGVPNGGATLPTTAEHHRKVPDCGPVFKMIHRSGKRLRGGWQCVRHQLTCGRASGTPLPDELVAERSITALVSDQRSTG